MRTGYLITARLKSTRLPNKLMLTINGKEVIRYMIERLKTASHLDEIVIATSTNEQDSPLEALARSEGVKCFRGSEDDVLERLYGAAKEFDLDYVLNITADCPLVSVEYVEKIIAEYQTTDADLIRCFDLPHGFYSYGIKVAALKKVLEIKSSSDTEVWGRYFTDNPGFKVVDLKVPKEHQLDGLRLTLDYPEDFEFFKKVFGDFNYQVAQLSLEELLRYFKEHPEVKEINYACEERYKKRWQSQNKMELRSA